MTSAAIRERLYDFIRVADDRKIQAIYTMLETEVEEASDWWKDKVFTDELAQRFQYWKDGKSKASTLTEIDELIAVAKARKVR